jgi:hypothetical protein
VLERLANGAVTTDIARELAVNDHEIESSLATLFTRMGVANRSEAIAVAVRRGLLGALGSSHLEPIPPSRSIPVCMTQTGTSRLTNKGVA